MKFKIPRFDSKFTQVTIITIIAIILSKTAIYSLSSAFAFKSDLEVKDFRFSDIYNSVSDNPSVRQISDRVVLLSVDGCPRETIAEVIEAANSCSPAAIGVDVMFEYPGEDDSRLIRSVIESNNLVLAGKAIGYDQEKDSFDHLEQSYFCEYFDGIESAPVNLESRLLTDIIREFRTDFNCAGSKYDAFPVALATKADKYHAERLKSRETRRMKSGKDYHKETIYYPTIDFETVTADELLSNTETYRKTLEDKILIIGDIENVQDMHSTPVRGMLSGTMIHAMAVETILKERYIREASGFVNWFIAILICVSFIWVNLVIKDHLPGTGRLIMRILQILFLYACFMIGCKVFAKRMLYLDFSPSLMMMALGFFAYDIWLGVLAIYGRAKDKINSRKKCSEDSQ